MDKARKINIAEHPVWHRLMFYEENSDSASGVESAVRTNDFFLSSEGRNNPLAELLETLNAFADGNKEAPDEHAQCVFRGRFIWLKEQLGFTEKDFVFQECIEYEKWSKHKSIKSISVILATGYLGNPASYYGHLLVKMNSDSESKQSSLEDVSINYGAIVLDSENPVVYMAKGMFGGYHAGFSHIQFYFHNHNYGENENRNLWEYELELSYDEVQLVVAHAWESLKQKYDYYFLDKNCAYMIADLFKVVEGVDILPENPLWVVPQSVMQKISASQRNGKSLIKSVAFHPSRQSRLYQRFSDLSRIQKNVVDEIVDDIEYLNNEKFIRMELVSKQKVLDVLLDYYQYIREAEELTKDESNIDYRKVLARRYKLPAGEPVINFTSQNVPHKGRKPSMFNVGFLDNENLGNGYRLSVRPAYYDSLDADFGHVSNARLSMAELQLAVFDSELFVRSFDFVNIDSVNRYATGLPGDRGMSWKLRFGFEQQNLACKKCLVTRLQGDMGMTSGLGDSVLLGAYLGGSVHDNKRREGNVFSRLSVFTNIEYSRLSRFRFEAEQREYFHSQVEDGFKGAAWWRYRLSKNSDIRIGYEKSVIDEVSVSASLYW